MIITSYNKEGNRRIILDEFNPRIHNTEWRCVKCWEWDNEEEITFVENKPYCKNCVNKDEDEKLFKFHLEETTGDRQYDYKKAVFAESLGEAWEKAKEYARNFYGEAEEEEEIVLGFEYTFEAGEIILNLWNVEETTTEEFKEELLQDALR